MTHAADLLVRMAGLLRPGSEWAGIDPAPVFDPDPRLGRVESQRLLREAPDGADEAVARAEALQPTLNAFTSIFHDAAAVPGPLAGLSFAVKDLFDVAGVVTLAGSIARKDDPPAAVDATAVARLRRDGALLVGATNMDE